MVRQYYNVSSISFINGKIAKYALIPSTTLKAIIFYVHNLHQPNISMVLSVFNIKSSALSMVGHYV